MNAIRLPGKYIFLLLVGLLLFLSTSGCGNNQPAQKPQSQPLRIAVSLADMERDGNKIIKEVMDSRKKGDQVEITWLDAKNDQAKQEKQLEELANKKVKALVFQPVNPVTGPDLMRKLVEKDIKLVALETLPVDVPVDAYVASDHNLTGQLLARFATMSARKSAGLSVPPDSADYKNKGGLPPEAQLGGKLPIGVMILGGDPMDTAAREIAASARATVRESSEVRLVAEQTVPRSDPSLVPGVLQKALLENGNNIRVVLATDSRLAMAAADVLKSAGLNNRVLTAGVGADQKSSQALAAGDHDAEVDTRPDLLGQFALDAAISLAKEGRWQYDGQYVNGSYSVPARIIPVRLIQSGNVYLLDQRWKPNNKEKGNQGGQQGGGGSESGGGGSESGEGSGSEGGSGGNGQQSQSGGQENQQKTMLRITTKDGKTMEVQIDGEIKKIESMGGGQQGQQQGKESQQGQSQQ